MRWLRFGWAAFLVAVFLVFTTWYGGNGRPINAEEGAALISELTENYRDAPESEREFVENMKLMIPNDDGREFYAVNLERLKQGEFAEQADDAYGRVVFPILFKRGGHPVFVSRRAGLMLGDYGNEVDRVAVVRYRSLRDLIDMVNDPAMIAGGHHKFASLDHTEVFITRPYVSFMQVRIMVAMVLIIVGVLGWYAIGILKKARSKQNVALNETLQAT